MATGNAFNSIAVLRAERKGLMKLNEVNIKQYIGKEVFCIATQTKVLLRGYRGGKLAQISHAERFVKGEISPCIT